MHPSVQMFGEIVVIEIDRIGEEVLSQVHHEEEGSPCQVHAHYH